MKVDELPSPLAMKQLARHIRYPERGWDEVTVFLAMPDTRGLAYFVAEFPKGGAATFQTNDFALADSRWDSGEVSPDQPSAAAGQ